MQQKYYEILVQMAEIAEEHGNVHVIISRAEELTITQDREEEE